MRREDIANFLTAKRSVSPLMAFSLLIVAGVFAGSLQIVAPVHQEIAFDPHAQTAQAAATTGTSYDSPAPESCTEAIKSALGKMQGPEVTSTDKGQSGTVDACFGGILKKDKVKPSQKTEDYDCVGRRGKVTITADSTIGKTYPDRSVPKGQCKVEVCQPYMTNTPDGPKRMENCGQPKQFGAGQSVTPASGGVPQIPATGASAPSSSSTPIPQTPAPNGSGSTPAVQPLEDVKPNTPTGPNAADQIKDLGACPGSPGCPGNPATTNTELGDCPGSPGCPGNNGSTFGTPSNRDISTLGSDEIPPNTPGSLGDQLGAGDLDKQMGVDGVKQQSTFSPGAASNPYLNGEYTPNSNQVNNPNALTPSNADVQSPGAASNPWLNGNIPANSSATNDPNSLTPSALEPNVEKMKGVWAGADQPGVNALPPAQDLDSGIKTPINCTDAGCTAKPVTPADTAALEKDGFKCTSGTCTRTSQAAPDLTSPGACPGSVGCPGRPGVQTPPFVPPGSPVPPPAPTPSPAPASSGSGLGSGLSSLLSGMMKGLAGAMGAQQPQQSGPAQTCPKDPQAYAQYQQQYNQQLQQYNYQLQQYNYQQQNSYSSYPPPAPTPPQPCQQGSGAGQCQPLPAQPPASNCPQGTWRQMTTAQGGDARTGSSVCPVWQCVMASDTTPTAQLSCNPAVAEKGSQVLISYSCTNALTSTGYGFTTGGQVSGSTSTILVDPPENAAGINYAIKCENGAVSAGAQCSVQIAKVSISLRAEPQPTRVGESALIGWVTTGMESCVVSSPDQPDFTSRNANSKKTTGIATTSPITETSDFYLNCKTVTGSTREEKVTVEAYRPGTVSTSIDARTNAQRGSTATIQWNFPDAPDVSAVALWLYSVDDEQTVALITGHRAKSGSYTWEIPRAEDSCNTSSSLVCGSDIVPGRTYEVLATLYSPPNAGLGEFGPQNLPVPKYLDNPESRSFRFSQ